MSVASTISRNGKSAVWKKMLGKGGDYDPATGKVVAPTYDTQNIKMILDGFGSVESTLKAFVFGERSLLEKGQLRAFTVSALRPGDVVHLDDEVYTVVAVKSIWKKSKVVLYEAVIQL